MLNFTLWSKRLWNKKKPWLTATSTHSHLLIQFLSLAVGFWPPCPLFKQRGTIYKMGPVLSWQMPECCVFSLPLALSAEIRGFKVLSYNPIKELPICSQVIRGKHSCIPSLSHAKLCFSHIAPDPPPHPLFTSFGNTGGYQGSSPRLPLMCFTLHWPEIHVIPQDYLYFLSIMAIFQWQSTVTRFVWNSSYPICKSSFCRIPCRQIDKTEPSAAATEF